MARSETNRPGTAHPGYGALVISLDCELHWGVRDHQPADGPYRQNLLGARNAIPRMLDLFEEYGIAATWATVGFLFAGSRRERESFSPRVRPCYSDPSLDPYREPTGEGEADDPLHYAPSLIEQIHRRPRQEVATHTFSHYYCMEPGHTPEAFAADLRSAIAIGNHYGLRMDSIVFPRNQFHLGLVECLLDAGITCYRGNQRGWIYRSRPRGRETLVVRAPRLLDQYLNLAGALITDWREILEPSGLCNVRASMFLRPGSARWQHWEEVRLSRIVANLEAAAREKAIFHLWWHPHNFGVGTENNLAFLRRILDAFACLRQDYGMRSLCMREVGEIARAAFGCSAPEERNAEAYSAMT